MENHDLQSIRAQLDMLEKRVHDLESIINGSSKRKPGRKSKLSHEQKEELIRKHEQGLSYSALADEYHVSRSTICNICRGHNPLTVKKVCHDSIEISVQTYESAK